MNNLRFNGDVDVVIAVGVTDAEILGAHKAGIVDAVFGLENDRIYAFFWSFIFVASVHENLPISFLSLLYTAFDDITN